MLESSSCRRIHNNYSRYYTLQSPSVFSLAKSLQLILGNSATYRLVNNLQVARAMHDFQEQCQVHGQQCQVRGQRSKNGFYNKKIRMACIIKQLLDSVFVISGKIKVSVSIISLSLRLRLITLTSTFIIPDITKSESNNCL